MNEYQLSFAGRSIIITWDDNAAAGFLNLLFADLPPADGAQPAGRLHLRQAGAGSYQLGGGVTHLHCGPLDVTMAAHLFDAVIFRLLAQQDDGLALHAGAVIRDGRVLLLPGESGSGKSTLTGWLISQGCGYLTDELVLIPAQGKLQTLSFTRPLCIKHGSAATVKGLLPPGKTAALEDGQGLILPHRQLNAAFTPITRPPALILFPAYRPGATLEGERLSGARASALLMTCNVNGRNLTGHGFPLVAHIARTVPAIRLVYSSFHGLSTLVDQLLATLPQP
ncbi:MAG: hypothetical protein RBT36_03140 [Desulfobulbus sp.]|jgi:hypothetical protein|nr:hypothetical protein [Desulfobulbus sp.]